MIELYIDPRGEIAIENMEELLEQYPRYAERAVASALKSEGYNLKEKMKSAIQRGGPDGQKWQDRQRVVDILTRARNSSARIKNFRWEWSDRIAGRKRKRIKKWLWQQRENGYDSRPLEFRAMQRLAGGIRYKYDDNLSMMTVGFINRSGLVGSNFARIIRMQASGYETVVSRAMQKMAWALGLRTGRVGSRFKIPARPLVGPIFNQEKDKMTDRIETTFYAAIIRYIAEGR